MFDTHQVPIGRPYIANSSDIAALPPSMNLSIASYNSLVVSKHFSPEGWALGEESSTECHSEGYSHWVQSMVYQRAGHSGKESSTGCHSDGHSHWVQWMAFQRAGHSWNARAGRTLTRLGTTLAPLRLLLPDLLPLFPPRLLRPDLPPPSLIAFFSLQKEGAADVLGIAVGIHEGKAVGSAV
jgi:hypothetical protein